MYKILKPILVPHGTIKRLAEHTGYSTETVKYALRGARCTEAAEQIRELAIKEYGGRIQKR